MSQHLKVLLGYLAFYGFGIYMTYHAFSGERGILALIRLNTENVKLYSELENVKADRIHLEHKVSLMRPDSLDLDLLEEQAKKILGLIGKDEKVIFNQ